MNSIIEVLRSMAVLHAPPGKPFVLKSGATSMHYIDVRLASLSAEGLRVIASELFQAVCCYDDVRYVAGVVAGGCPLATGVSMMSLLLDQQFDALYVRPEAKDHGTGKLVEGRFEVPGRVVLLEDVVTSGGSSLRAIDALQAVGLTVVGVVAVLDREQGGAAAIRERCNFQTLCRLKELVDA